MEVFGGRDEHKSLTQHNIVTLLLEWSSVKLMQSWLNIKMETYVDLIVVKAVPQVLEEWIFSQGFEEDHVANPDHVV